MAKNLSSFKYLILFVFLYFKEATGNVCINDLSEDQCLCKLNEYSKIDLTSLIPKDNKPDNSLVAIVGDRTYYFHGCKNGIHNNVTVKNKTINITYSLLIMDSGNFTAALVSKEINFEPADDKAEDYQIVYRSGDSINASIRLVCTDFDYSLLNVVNNVTNKLVLLSPHVCVNTKHPGLSTGSVLLILFFFCVGTYLLGGMLVLYFMRGARGVEVIPNIDFWKSLPGLVKDGVIFLLSGCQPTFISTAESYDRI